MKTITTDDVEFSKKSIVDDAGKVFFYQNRVFRAIYNIQKVKFFKDFLQQKWIEELFGKGLVKTWICTDIHIKDIPLILEHQKISFDTHPCEWTSEMFWAAAQTLVKINIFLSQYGYILKDSHPYNLMYFKGNPVFIDFGSIIKQSDVSKPWFEEFRTYFVVPIWLSKVNQKNLAIKYRREHLIGFGLEVFRKTFLKNILFFFNRLEKFNNNPSLFFNKLNVWLVKNRPSDESKQVWSDYDQSHQTVETSSPKTIKQKFVFDVLKKEQPQRVLDSAANKGYYSEMAARIGASVIAFDYERFCVNQCLTIAKNNNLDITPVIMDFRYPTPNHGLGLCGEDAFQRFNSDIVLALGLVHHLCLTQNFPVCLFCHMCLKYASKGLIWEYVDPQDKHVVNWDCEIPKNYTYENFIYLFSEKFNQHESIDINEDGLRRKLVYFY